MTAVDGSAAWTYTYNADGLRLSRTDGTTEYNYVYLGGQLVYMTIGDSVTMKFNYDANGAPVAVQYNGTTYYYITNLQGDIVGIVNQAGTRIVSYAYDAWGNLLSTTTSGTTNANNLANNNPLRYRGYIYDNETGLYYLQSRYYDPEIGRFLGADVVYDYDAGLQGYNLFIYCGNNPVNRIDISGADSSELNGCKDLLDDPLLEGGGGGNGLPSGGNSGSGQAGTASNWSSSCSNTGDLPSGNSGGGNGDVVIYRYGYTGSEKLVPTQDDVDSGTGLSFSMRYRPGSATTTINTVNSSGILVAVQDKRNHVSIYPTTATIAEWRAIGASSIWTRTLVQLVTLS